MGVSEDRLMELLADAGGFFETYLWEAESAEPAGEVLAEEGLEPTVVRAFGVGYAPVGPDELMDHLRGLGYTTDEIVAAGLANRSPRGRAHAHFRSRVMFPVRERTGRTLGFAGLGTHLGPSWALWVTSPNGGLYRPTHAVFGIDRAARRIAASGSASVQSDCIAVLRAHQEGKTNAVTVHSSEVTREQLSEIAVGVRGGIDALELDLPSGIEVEAPRASSAGDSAGEPRESGSSDAAASPAAHAGRLDLSRLGIVVATALAAINAWTGAPLLALWVGSQVQPGRLLTMWGVVTVVAVLAALEFLLGWGLSWLSVKYDALTGRPRTATQTSPWHRANRGDRVQDIRARYGVSAPERVVAAVVVAGVLAFEIWFFFLAGSPI